MNARHRSPSALIGLVLASLCLPAARALAQPVLPYPAVPAPRYEAVPPPPGERFVWQPGHWHWNGAGYVWIAGRYVARPAQYARYVPGHWHWNPHRAAWIWVPAHWG